MTGLSASSWRNAKPLAAPSAIFIRIAQGRGSDPILNKIMRSYFQNIASERLMLKKKHKNFFVYFSIKENRRTFYRFAQELYKL